jgi:hypothetical protein
LGVTTAAASNASIASRPEGGRKVTVARFAGGAVFVAVSTALWIAWRSGSDGGHPQPETSVGSELPEPSRQGGTAAPPALSTGTRAAIVAPPSAAAPPSAVSSSAVPLDPVPASAGTGRGPRVVFASELVPTVVSPSAPATAHKPHPVTKSATTRGPRGSQASATSRAPTSARPAAPLDDLALEPGPRAPSAPQSDPSASKHNLGF